MAMRKVFKQDEFREIGFGSKIVGTLRLMNKDGSSNVNRAGGNVYSVSRFYHTLITMSWGKFFLFVLCAYLVLNLFFAILYFIVDPDHITGMVYNSTYEKFLEIFFFSSQSLTTVGYGRLNPVGAIDSSIAAIESLVGLLSFAIATGILYARFSRPVANILFSHNALIAPYKGATGLMLRLANKNKSELLDPEATVVMAYIENDESARKFANLKLELTKVTLLTMSWTIVHPIDQESPVYGWTEEDFKNKKAEFLVMIRVYEETFSQTVQSRTSYLSDEIIYGAKFQPIVKPMEDGSVTVELKKINDYTRVALFETVNANIMSERS